MLCLLLSILLRCWRVHPRFCDFMLREYRFAIAPRNVQGASTREQLELIIAKLGTPSEAELRNITKKPVLDTIRRLPLRPPPDWRELLPHASPMALDLLTRMLRFDQFERITVDVSSSVRQLGSSRRRALWPVSDARTRLR